MNIDFNDNYNNQMKNYKPDYNHLPSGESHKKEFVKNLKGNNSKLKKLVEADKLHLKHHPSPDDAMELQEDKTKLKLLKYIDSKWFNLDNLKERKIKLLKNRVIKRINSGEFLHKKEVNKYIKDYYSKQ